MTQTESSLGDAGDLLQSARELLVQAGNATLSDTDRQSIATQLQSIRGQLLDDRQRQQRRRHATSSAARARRRSPSSTRRAACSTPRRQGRR